MRCCDYCWEKTLLHELAHGYVSLRHGDPTARDAGRLSLVVRAGAGYDNIDVPAATRRGVLPAWPAAGTPSPGAAAKP